MNIKTTINNSTVSRQILIVYVLVICNLIDNRIMANEILYSANEVERPLVLPAGMAEINIDIGAIHWTSTDEGFNNATVKLGVPPIVIKYGITKNLQLHNAGIVYRFLDRSKLETVVIGAINSFVYHSHGGANIDYSIGVLSKQKFSQQMAISYEIYNKYRLNSSFSDEDVLGISAVVHYAIGNTVAFSFAGKYEKKDLVNDLHMTDTGVVISIQDNIYPNFDLRYSIDLTHSSEENNANNDYTTGKFNMRVKWRWGEK